MLAAKNNYCGGYLILAARLLAPFLSLFIWAAIIPPLIFIRSLFFLMAANNKNRQLFFLYSFCSCRFLAASRPPFIFDRSEAEEPPIINSAPMKENSGGK